MATAKKAPVSRKQPGASAKKAALKKPAAAPVAVAPAGPTKTASTSARVKKPVAKPAPAPKPKKPAKAKKPKLVRDSFTVPKAEYVVLDELKQRATRLAHPIKKSELLRAGIKALAAMSDTGFLSALDQVPTIKTGRPAG